MALVTRISKAGAGIEIQDTRHRSSHPRDRETHLRGERVITRERRTISGGSHRLVFRDRNIKGALQRAQTAREIAGGEARRVTSRTQDDRE